MLLETALQALSFRLKAERSLARTLSSRRGTTGRGYSFESALKLVLAMNIGKTIFGRDVTKGEVSRLSELGVRTVGRIVKDQDFLLFLNHVSKESLSKLGLVRIIPDSGKKDATIIDRKRWRLKRTKKVGRPDVVYRDTGKPGWMRLAEKHLPEARSIFKQMLKTDPESRNQMAHITARWKKETDVFRQELLSPKLPMVEGMVAYQMVQSYSDPALQSIPSFFHDTYAGMVGRAKGVFRYYLNQPNSKERDNLLLLEQAMRPLTGILEFSKEYDGKRTAEVLTKWAQRYDLEGRRKRYLDILSSGSYVKVVLAIIESIDEELRLLLAS